MTNQNLVPGLVIGGGLLAIGLGIAFLRKSDTRAQLASNEYYTSEETNYSGGFTRRKKRNQNKTKRK
jgi:hypothetical protein